MKAILVLEDGTTYEGESIGAKGTTIGEVVFSTCMTGYQEMLTDPSYAGQILTLTYPLIGNYGVNHDDFESSTIQVEGFVVKHLCEVPSNWRAISNLNDFLKEQNVVGIQGVDTRALTRHLRIQGVMLGGITTDYTREEMLNKIANAPDYGGIDFTKRVTTKSPYVWKNSVNSAKPEFDVALLDFGVKRNILRSLCALNCRVTVYPCNTPAEQILDANPDGIILSPGPGDPALLSEAIENVKKLIGKKPIMGVCLGNQLLGWAFGSTTYKLKFGHRGGNHPVKELATGKVFITSQNHGYAVDPDGLKNSGMEVSHININDGTVEGLCHKELPIFSIQYHPEASPGPMDSKYLFQRFVEMLRNNK